MRNKIALPRADVYLLGITVIWGSTFSVTKHALVDISPLMLQALRFALAALVVGIYTWKDVAATSRTSVRAGIVLGIFLGLGFAFQTLGLQSTSASKAGFLTGTLVIFTPILQLLIERRLPTIGNIIGVILVAIGLFIFTSPAGESFNGGDFLVLLCAIVFAFYIVLLDVFTKKKFNREIVFYQFVVTSLIALLLLPFVNDQNSIYSTSVLLSIVYLALFASVIAIFVQSKYQRETTPTKAAVIFTMEPVLAAVIAFMFLHEKQSLTSIFGASIMLAGLFVSELWSLRGNAIGVKES